MSTKEIPLRGGYIALVDEEDFAYLSQHKWRRTHHGRSSYVSTQIAGKQTYMHRLIMNPPDEIMVDHINGDGLDNRRANLRHATPQQNSMNRVRSKENSASKYLGVFLGRDGKSWRAQIVVNTKLIYLGVFRTQREAALAYNEASRLHNGEFASLNEIPDHDPGDVPFPEPRVTSSGFHGVYQHGKKWQAAITVNGKQIHIGIYATPQEAAKARNSYITNHGLKRSLAEVA